MLPTPSLNFMNRVKNKMYKFIWNNKRDKIKRTIMNQEYKLGGCKMIDINVQNNALNWQGSHVCFAISIASG